MPAPAPKLAAFAVAVLGTLAIAPGTVLAGGVVISPVGSFVIADDDDCTLKMRVRDEGTTWKIQADGCFEVSDDETDIVTMPAGGWFRAEARRYGRTQHSIEIRRPRGAEALARTYERGGKSAAWDNGAQEFLADALGVVFQHSSFGRDAHIQRVLARDGIDGALAEIADLSSDHQKRKAYERLITLRPDESTLLSRIAGDADGRIDSSYEMAELLVAVAGSRATNADVLAVAARTARSIDSDYERRKALQAILRAPARDAQVVGEVLRNADRFDSDHERGELLCTIAADWPAEGALGRAYFAAVIDMDSDYERARALRAVVERGAPSSEVARGVAEAVMAIDSDYHKAEVLEAVADHPLDGAARDACVRAARTIDSDHHRGRVLDALHARES